MCFVSGSKEWEWIYVVEFPSLPQEVVLPPVAWMTNLNYIEFARYTMSAFSCIAANCHEPCGSQQCYDLTQNLFTHQPLPSIVRSISEGIARFMGVKRKHVPKKNWNIHFV